jgi:hypothetical protein
MRSVSRKAACSLVVSVALSLTVVAAALAARAGGYAGKTSQHQPVSFRISNGAVRGFNITVHDKCPDGHTLGVHATYPTMKITNGKFGGAFSPVGGHPGEHASLHGKLGRSAVTGTLSDTSFSRRERVLCHGSTTFTAHHA